MKNPVSKLENMELINQLIINIRAGKPVDDITAEILRRMRPERLHDEEIERYRAFMERRKKRR